MEYGAIDVPSIGSLVNDLIRINARERLREDYLSVGAGILVVLTLL